MTVGIIAYDETKMTRSIAKVEGWVENLYVNYTGKLVEKGQPLFTIYSPDLPATQTEYLAGRQDPGAACREFNSRSEVRGAVAGRSQQTETRPLGYFRKADRRA